MSAPFMSILSGFAAAAERDRARYRCTECGATRRGLPGVAEPFESLPCWAADGDIICTGLAVLEPEHA